MLCIVFKVPPDIIGSQYEKLIIQKLNVTLDIATMILCCLRMELKPLTPMR